MAKEKCAGCGIESDAHPFVGIAKPTDETAPYQLPDIAASPRGFVAYGVCEPCWKNPEHRQRTLKMSYFHRSQLASALAEAGSNDVKGA